MAKLRFRMFKVDSLKSYAGNARNAVANTGANQSRDFLADSLEETYDCEDLQLQATTNFKAYHVDAYDLDCDDEATTNAIFMANLAPVGSLNDDTVAPRYDFDTLFEVPHYDTYHDSNVLNSNIQELGYIENIVFTNESYNELKGNNDVISYTNYMLTIGDDADNYVPPPIQKNDMMLSVIKQTKSQVENCNKVNQESNSEIESLTSELGRYKDIVGVLGYAVKDGHSEQEAYLRSRKSTKGQKNQGQQMTKLEHGMEKTVQKSRPQSPIMPIVRVNTEESAVKPEQELRIPIECNINPYDGREGKPNSIFMKTVKTKWALNQFQQPICVQLTKTVKTLKAQS
ncbi:hypothetical protein Tco_0623291 [Tanacetum coccineum]